MSGGEIVKKIEGAEVLYFPARLRVVAPAENASQDRDADAEGDRTIRVAEGGAQEETPEAAVLSSASAGGASSVRAAAAGAAASSEKSSRAGGSDFSAAGGNGGRRRHDADDDDLDRRCARLPMTDLGNAERFKLRFGDKVRWCQVIGFMVWDDRRWNTEMSDGLVMLAEHTVVRAIQAEADAIRDTAADFIVETKGTKADPIFVMYSDKLAQWGRQSESANKLGAISKRAAPMLEIAAEALDRDPMKLNVLNGTLVFDKSFDGYVRLKPHDQSDLITKLAPVLYNPDAACPQYDAFMARVQPKRDDDGPSSSVRFLHQWAGLSLTGETGEQRYTFHYGKGRNGKGVWVSTVSHVLGDYAGSIRIESFLDSGRAQAGGQATPDIAKLPGVRFLTTSEPKKGSVLDEGLIKLFTGEDTISARFLNKEFFEFRPVAKLTMQGNYRPKISGTDEGIWNRTILVPWPIFIPKEERDLKLAHKLRAESSGILNRFLDGLRDWMDHGLILPGSVVAATEEYRSDSDPLGRFLEACTRADLGKRVQSSEMHLLFAAWAKANGEAEWTPKGLAMALKERGIASKKSVNMFWLDITLTKSVSDFLDDSGKPLRSGQASASGYGDDYEQVYD